MSAATIAGPGVAPGVLARAFQRGWCGCVTRDGGAVTPPVDWAEDRLRFRLPVELEATAPAEARGLARDGVRLLVTRGDTAPVTHTCARSLDRFLDPGDVLVLNTSQTLRASLPARPLDADRTREKLRVHLSQALPDGRWRIELRKILADGRSVSALDRAVGERFALPANATLTLASPLDPDGLHRLWIAMLELEAGERVHDYLEAHGDAIRYDYVRHPWPIDDYRTTFGLEPGSAEMPSAGRPLTADVFRRLRARGVAIAPIVLHTGVASLEDDEPPYAEPFRVPEETARIVNRARSNGRRVVAVGTTSVRAIESATDPDGQVHRREGWTELVIEPSRGLRTVGGLLTGFHEPRASHLWMLETLAGRSHLARAYEEALTHRYLWHEFGDVHLILPEAGYQ